MHCPRYRGVCKSLLARLSSALRSGIHRSRYSGVPSGWLILDPQKFYVALFYVARFFFRREPSRLWKHGNLEWFLFRAAIECRETIWSMAKRRKSTSTLLKLLRGTREREKLIFPTLKISFLGCPGKWDGPPLAMIVRSAVKCFYLLYTSDNCTMDTNFPTCRRVRQGVYFNAIMGRNVRKPDIGTKN